MNRNMRKNKMFILTCVILSLIIVSMLYIVNLPTTSSPYEIAVIVPDSSDNSWKRVEEGMRQAAEIDNVNVNFVNTSDMYTLDDEKNLVLREIKNGADGVIVQFLESANTEKIISELSEGNHIELLMSDVSMYEKDSNNIHKILFDDALGAMTLTSQIFDDFGRDLRFKQIGIFAGNQRQKNMQIRLKTVQDILEKSGAIISWVVDGEEEEMNKQLNHVNQPSLLIGLDSFSLDAGIQYATETDLPLYGIGGSDKSVSALDEGILKSMIVPDSFMMGYYAIHSMYQKIHLNQNVKDKTIDFYTVTKDNMFSRRNEKILFPIGD